ncbi:hypothetical protein ABG067_003664 [Albugo candida]
MQWAKQTFTPFLLEGAWEKVERALIALLNKSLLLSELYVFSQVMDAIIPAKRVLEFLRICGRLKQVKRSGWVRNKIPDAESVADHMYRMSMCCMLLNDARIDQNKSSRHPTRVSIFSVYLM